jgi:hypothetical protein
MTDKTPWVPPGEGVKVVPGARGYTMPIPEVCVRLAVLPTRLAQWRKLGVGPSYARPGGHPNSPIFYRPAEIEDVRQEMLERREAESRAEVAARIASTTPPKPRAKKRKK